MDSVSGRASEQGHGKSTASPCSVGKQGKHQSEKEKGARHPQRMK